MTTLLDSLQLDNSIDINAASIPASAVQITQAIKTLPGISELNVEKALISVFPDFDVQNVNFRENESKIFVDFNVKLKFDFNIEPFKQIIDKYFQLEIKKLSTDDQNDVTRVLDASLFSFKNLPLSNFTLQGNPQIISSKLTSFGAADVVKLDDGFEYNFNIKTKELDADKIKNGASYRNPGFLLYSLTTKFDIVTFQRDFGVENFGISEDNNGKSMLISLINNGVIEGREWNYKFINTNDRWLGASSNSANNQKFSYSNIFYDSRRIEISSILLGNKLNQLASLQNLIKDIKFPNAKTLDRKSPRLNVHTYGAISSPIQIFFDIDWNGLLLDNIPQKKLLKANPGLSSMARIVSMRVMRTRVDSKSQTPKVEILGTAEEINGKINFSNDKIKILEKKYDLITGNENIRSFILTDASFDRTPFNGQYQYSLQIEIRNDISTFVQENRDKLLLAQRDIRSYEAEFSKKSNNKKENNIQINEEKYLNCLKTFFDTLTPLIPENSIFVDQEIQRTYAFSNPVSGIVSGIGSLKDGIDEITEIYNRIDNITRFSGKNLAKADKKNFTVEFKFKQIYKNNKSGISYLNSVLEKPTEVDQFLVNRLFITDLEEINLESINPTKVTFQEKDDINFIDRNDVSLLINQRNRKIQTKGMLGEILSSKEQSQIISFRDFVLEEGTEVQLKPSTISEEYIVDDNPGIINNLNVEVDVISNQEEVLFDNKLGSLDVVPLLERLGPKKEELPKAEMQYLSGYSTSDDDVILMKKPVWVKIENLDDVRDLNVLCRFEKIREESTTLPTLNKYFLLGDIDNERKTTSQEAVSLENLEAIHEKEKLRVLI